MRTRREPTEGNAEARRLELPPASFFLERRPSIAPGRFSPTEPCLLAETTQVAETATLPSIDEIERAAAFTREPFVLEGEDPASTLSPGSPRRRALDAALAEIEAGARTPSVEWRRHWSLMLGLDRLLSQDEPTLVDGTVLSAHQVDALSGTLTALLADAQRNGNGHAATVEPEDLEALAPVGIPGEEEPEEDDDEADEPQDWAADYGAEDDGQLPEQP